MFNLNQVGKIDGSFRELMRKLEDPRIIITPDAVEMREVIEDVRLHGRGIAVHNRKVTRAFPAIYQTPNNTILVHPKFQQEVHRILNDSIEKDLNRAILRGSNGR